MTVAVLDTGVAYRSHGDYLRSPDFSARQFARGFDFVDRDPLPLDENGHGTHVAGTIGERTGNGIGLTGLAYRARLMPVRVLDREGRGDAASIAKGVRSRSPTGPGDQHELQLRLRQEGAGGRLSAARRPPAGRPDGRLGRQPRLRELRLGAGHRTAGDRRRRHHRGRLPRRLLARRAGDRHRRAGRRQAGGGLPLDLRPADLPGHAEAAHPQTSPSPATTSAPRWRRPTSPASRRWRSPPGSARSSRSRGPGSRRVTRRLLRTARDLGLPRIRAGRRPARRGGRDQPRPYASSQRSARRG